MPLYISIVNVSNPLFIKGHGDATHDIVLTRMRVMKKLKKNKKADIWGGLFINSAVWKKKMSNSSAGPTQPTSQVFYKSDNLKITLKYILL